LLQQQILVKEMKQVIKKTIKEAKNINYEPLIYTLLVDGNNLMKISSVDKRMNGKGEEYGIVFQFLWQLHKLLQVKDYNFVYVMLDGEKSGQLRYNFYQDYKANRDKNYELSGSKSEYDKQIDAYVKKVLDYSRNKHKQQETVRGETEEESFERQKLILKQILEELFVRVCEYDEVEGDDLIAHYVKNKKSNEMVVIVSGDRDLTQLINDEVCVYIPSLKKYISPKNHIQELGYTHENVLIKKILCGDSSDNIKGIKGMGDKTFFSLFPDAKTKKYTLDDIFVETKKNIEERLKNKQKPLQVTENILNKVTLGSQGDKIYEINDKIINLSNPLLTKEAKEELDNIMYAPLDPEGRDLKNIYQIIQENEMNDMLDEKKFGNLFAAFYKLIDTEKKYFKNI
jgi:5'-3' exonuclease